MTNKRRGFLGHRGRQARFRKQWAQRKRLTFELLEAKILLASDFGDAPLPYPVTLAEGGARHTIGVLRLGPATVDMEADGTHSAAADFDDQNGSTPADEDGVTFGAIQVGALAQIVTVNVQGSSGLLDAWIDFNGDGNWGGAGNRSLIRARCSPETTC